MSLMRRRLLQAASPQPSVSSIGWFKNLEQNEALLLLFEHVAKSASSNQGRNKCHHSALSRFCQEDAGLRVKGKWHKM